MAASKKQAKGRLSSGPTTRGATKPATPSKTNGKTTGKTGATGKTETTSGSGRKGTSGKTISPVSGRFLSTTTAHRSAGGQAATRKSAIAREGTAVAPAVRGHRHAANRFSLDVVEPGVVADMSALVTQLAFPKGTLDKLVEKAALLQGFTGTRKSETFIVAEDLAAYLKALRSQLDEVVLPGVLARLIKGAVPIPPEDLAERMLSVAPAPAPASKMAEQVGPEYYDTNGVKTILAGPGAEPVSKQAVEHRRNRHTILALQTADRRWIYPTWQFRDHDVLPGLADVLATFYPSQPSEDQTVASADSESVRPGAVALARSVTREEPFSRWSVATWVTTPLRDLDGLSVADWLLEDRDRDRIVQLARRTAAAWAA